MSTFVVRSQQPKWRTARRWSSSTSLFAAVSAITPGSLNLERMPLGTIRLVRDLTRPKHQASAKEKASAEDLARYKAMDKAFLAVKQALDREHAATGRQNAIKNDEMQAKVKAEKKTKKKDAIQYQ